MAAAAATHRRETDLDTPCYGLGRKPETKFNVGLALK